MWTTTQIGNGSFEKRMCKTHLIKHFFVENLEMDCMENAMLNLFDIQMIRCVMLFLR